MGEGGIFSGSAQCVNEYKCAAQKTLFCHRMITEVYMLGVVCSGRSFHPAGNNVRCRNARSLLCYEYKNKVPGLPAWTDNWWKMLAISSRDVGTFSSLIEVKQARFQNLVIQSEALSKLAALIPLRSSLIRHQVQADFYCS